MGLGIGATVVGGVAAIAVPARSAGAVVVLVLLGFTVGLWGLMVRRDRDVLGLAFAMAPGLVLLLFAALADRPLSPALQMIRVVGYAAVFPACAVVA